MGVRKKRILYNSICAIISEIVSIICGLILPRVILQHFGSSYNGLIASITTFISYIVLLKSGIGGVTRASLYKPLADKNDDEISGIVNATSNYMKKVAYIFLAFLFFYAVFYPFLVIDEFDWIFSSMLIVVIGISTFMQYYFVLAYQMLLKADQKEYIILILNIITTILNTIISVILIKLNFGILFIKFSSALVYVINPIFLSSYVKKHYNLNKKIAPNNIALKQRWDSLAHAIAGFVHGNTDVVLLTIFTNTLEVSVYSVYNYITLAIRKGITAVTTGMEAAFGNIIAKGETKLLHKNFNIYEFIVFNITSIIISVTLVLCLPFVQLYTTGIKDINYIRPLFSFLIIISEFFYCIRIPYEDIVRAFGHYRQTRNAAIVEPCLNIFFSLVFVKIYGMVGVAIGTLIAIVFRTLRYGVYVQRKLIKRNLKECFIPYFISFFILIFSTTTCYYLFSNHISSYYLWIFAAFGSLLISCLYTFIFNFLFNKKMLYEAFNTFFLKFLNKFKKNKYN